MMRAAVALALAATGIPAAAQDAPRGFPLEQSYRAISISGFDVQAKGLSLTLSRKGGSELRAFGNAGCNSWTAGVILRDDQIDFSDIVTTKKLCGKPEMKAEEAFLTSLRSARHWHAEGDRLIIEGDAARLLLKPGTAVLKPEKTKKTARRRAR